MEGDFYLATVWTDPTITVNSTPVKAVHMNELKTAIDAERTRRRITTVGSLFTDTITTGSAIEQEHNIEARASIGFTPIGTFTDPSIMTSNPKMTSNTAPTGYVASDSEGGYDAYKAFYGSDNSYWQADRRSWLRLQLPAAKVAVRYDIRAYAIFTPSAWTFEGSNNGTSWTVLDTQTAQTFSPLQRKSYIVPVANRAAYSYYRLNKVNTAVAGAVCIAMWEIFYGDELSGLRVKKAHIDELRAKVNALEVKTSGTTDCNMGCTGICTGCSEGCATGCSGDCTGDSSCSCFPAGTRILMHDFTEKNIEDIQKGDKVLGIDGKAYSVLFLYPTRLGNRALYRFGDSSLSWSEEHPIWTKFDDGSEYWGVKSMAAYLYEMNVPNTSLPETSREFGLKKRLPEVLWQNKGVFAHVDGWRRQWMIIDRSGTDSMVLYDLVTDGPGTMIANGYVVSAFATDSKFDFEKVKWQGLKGVTDAK